MSALEPYLFFNGNCREAMNFYASVFGGTPSFSTYAEAPSDPHGGGDRILHAHLGPGGAGQTGSPGKDQPSFVLMGSDTLPTQPVGVGGNFALNYNCATHAEQDRLFAALADGGRVIMPLQDTFWQARFAMLFDRFGNQWMLSAPPQA